MGRIGVGLLAVALGAGCSDKGTSVEPPAGEVSSALIFDDRAAQVVNELAGFTYTPKPGQKADCNNEATIIFASLYKGTNTTDANTRLEALEADPYFIPADETFAIPCIFALPLLLRTYLHPTTYARLSTAGPTEGSRGALKRMMWRLIQHRSKFVDATKDTWELHGSENIDALLKSTILLATNALRGTQYDNTALYKLDYPYHSAACSAVPTGPGCPAQPYNPPKTLLEHQSAWREYWKKYFKERARAGIGTEFASPGYAKYTLSSYYNVRDFAGSSIVRDQAEKFLTLYWADVAQDFQPTTGIRGGAQARSGKEYYKRQNSLKTFSWLYGWHNNDDWVSAGEWTQYPTLVPATSSYQPPHIVKQMATDTNRSVFAYVSRRPGLLMDEVEGERYQVGFAPGGTSLQRRFSFNTTDYVFGTLKVVPQSFPHDASGYQNSGNRSMGVTFADHSQSRLAVFGRATGNDVPPRGYAEIVGEGGNDAMVVARDPSSSSATIGVRVFISTVLWNNGVVGIGPWLFLRSGNGFAAVRIASGGYTINSADEGHGQMLELTDSWSPIVVQMGQASEYMTPAAFDPFVNFQHSVAGWAGDAENGFAAVPANEFTYVNGVLTYKSEDASETYVIHSGESYVGNVAAYPLPSVNGGGSVSPAKTYSSPYLEGYHDQYTVTLRFKQLTPVVLDFNY